MKEYRIGFVFTMQNAKYLICIIMNINEKVKKLRKITHFLPFFFKNGTQLCFRNLWAHKSSCRNSFGVCAISL